MTFILGAVLFLLGGFFGMLIVAFGSALPRATAETQDELIRQLRLVTDDE